ncbi:RalBP1-associated Eps domain-containing protein 2, partial [Trichinella zimbabwensis]
LLVFCLTCNYSFSMAQTVSVGPSQKPSSSIPTWSMSGGERSSRAVIQPVVFVDHSSMNVRMDVEKVNMQPAASVAVPSRSKSPVSSSLHSSSLRSPHSDSKWTSFDESEEESSSIEHLSVSEQQGLLQLPEDGTSEGDDSVEESFIITPSLRDYYTVCFNQLLEKTQRCNTGALRGQDAGVFEFFLKSKLSRSELGRIWKLADVNEDGYLNLDEFCVAMHLVVRRVKGNFPIPESLPPLLAPIPTPPRNATPVDEAIDKRWAKFGERAVGEPSIHRVTDGPDSPFLKDFTNALMLSNEQGSRLAYPVACRASPDVGALGDHGTGKSLSNACSKMPHLYHYQQQQHSVNTSRTVVMSPQAPKGPPPKPPPRPVGNRHVRSASLDLTKSSRAPPTAPAPQLPRACLQRDSCAQTDLSVVMPSQHHSTVSVSSSSSYSSASSSATTTVTTTATTTTKLQQQSLPQRASPSTRHVIGCRQQPLAPPPPITGASTAALSTTIPIAAASTIVSCAAAATTTTATTTTTTTTITTTTTTTTAAAVVTATPFHGGDANAYSGSSTEPTDWKFRCEQISQMNATLEHELKQLTEYRIGLELKLNRMKKASREK